jgi:CHRD domain-containing protein
MRRFVPAVMGFAFLGCATTSSSQPDSSSKPSASTGSMSSGATEAFQARRDARNEVPPPNLDAGASPSGMADFKVSGTTVVYKLTVSGLSGAPTAAHIHLGAQGAAGPVIVPLTIAAGPSAGTGTGEGTFDAAAVKGKKPDGSAMTLDDVLSAMRSGGTYVNVHTANNKPGEARGQIEK